MLNVLKFTLYYFFYSLLIAGLGLLVPLLFPEFKLLAEKFWLIYGFLCGLTFIAYILADAGLKSHPETGIMAIMASIGLKMIFSMAFVLIYSLNAHEKGRVFLINFFSLYLLFTFFEIYCLLRNLRHQNK